MAREAITDRLGDLGRKVAKLRDTNPKTPWASIKEQLDIGQGKVMLAYLFHHTPESEKITGTDAAVAKAIVKQRDAGTSWAILSARTGLPESTCRKIYEQTTGNSTKGNRIGKGGRYPGDASPNGAVKKVAKKAAPVKKSAKVAPAKKVPAKKVAPAAKAPAKKAAPAKAAAKKAAVAKKASGTPAPATTSAGGAGGKLVDMNLEQITDRLEGRGITVRREGRKDQNYRIRKVTRLEENGNLTFVDAKNNNTNTVKVSDIMRATSG